MLEKVTVKPRHLRDYRNIITPSLYDELEVLAKKLRGRRVLHISANSTSGGVSELLHPLVALENDLGIKTTWQVLQAPVDFFSVTKQIHNGLQGDPLNLKPSQWDIYENYNRRLAAMIRPENYDFIVVHDPQPAAVLSFMPDRGDARWIWRCHIDSRHANPSYLRRFFRYWEHYDGVIFTMAKFVPAGFKPRELAVIPVAIDPLAPKNQAMSTTEAKKIAAGFGIDPNRPLVTQVSRFDPWKDPLGVVEAWREARRDLPDLQLALVGEMAADDPQSRVILKAVEAVSVGEDDIHVIAGRADDRAVKAFQTHSQAILQKSLREGFGLTVSEALWAGTPVIGGAVGGIPLQVIDGKSGYLVTSSKQAAQRIVELVRHPEVADGMGRFGHDLVRHKFLVPRLVRDQLQFLTELKSLPLETQA